MNVVDLAVPFFLFFMITVSVALLTRLIATGMLNKTIREALRSDPGSVPLLAAKLESRQPWADSLLGWIFVAFAVALAGLSFFHEGPERNQMLEAAVIPVVVGIAVLLYVQFARPRTPTS